MQKDLQKLLKKYNISLSESTVSMILGAVVVILIGILSFNYFRTNRAQTIELPPEVDSEAVSTVALPTTHEVTADESLWTIAEKYYSSGENYVDIAVANDLSNPDYLQLGQKLTIPKVEIRKTVVTENKIESDSYLVAKGDYLWSIAIRAYGDGYKWTQIAQNNKLINPDYIEVGQRLILPR